MYIEPLALFIIAEVVVVIIIISCFLFYRSRLLRVLLALLTEMRMNRARREVKKKQELAALRKQNAKLNKENDNFREEGQQTYAEQLQTRMEQLTEDDPASETDDLAADDDEAPDGHRTRAILRAFYEFETARSDPDNHDLKAAEDTLLEQLKIQLGRDPDEEESEAVVSQTAQLLERVKALEPLEPELEIARNELKATKTLLESAREQIRKLEDINATAEIDPSEVPLTGNAQDDEIYRLKCERFDMSESINALKLKLQKMVSDGDTSDLLEAQEEQIRQQEKYIRDADASIALLEKELEAAANQSATTDPKALQRAQEQRDQLDAYAQEQKASMQEMRDNLIAMRSAEKAEEMENLMKTQEDKLGQMERAIQESDTCVAIMENELHTANETIASLHEQLATLEAKAETSADDSADNNADKYRQQADEMESILRKLMQDSEDMVACIRELEAENEALKARA